LIWVQLFLAVVYLQWVLFLLLHLSERKISYNMYKLFPYLFLASFVFFVYLGLFTDFHIDAIYPYHLYVYSVLMYICYLLLDGANIFENKDVICLTFLIVFINSEYWEFPYRFFKIVNYGIDMLDIFQLTHFIPFILLSFSFDYKRVNFKILVKGLIFLLITSTIRIFLLKGIGDYHLVYMYLQRLGALYCLTRFFIESKKDDKM